MIHSEKMKLFFSLFIMITFVVLIYYHQLWQNILPHEKTRELTIKYEANASKWTPPKLPDHLENVDQHDQELIDHIRRDWIIPPFSDTHYIPQERHVKDFSEQHQPTMIDSILNHRKNGFIVECGACDGIWKSNSMFFEHNRNWTGILIEANPAYFSNLLKNNRHMYMLNACLSPSEKPQKLNFALAGEGGGIVAHISRGQQLRRKIKDKKKIDIQCFPLYSILAALGVNHVDYFSLDIEGAELDVLKTIPLDDIIIDTLTIEKRVVGDQNGTQQKERNITNYLRKYGYQIVKRLPLDIVVYKIWY